MILKIIKKTKFNKLVYYGTKLIKNKYVLNSHDEAIKELNECCPNIKSSAYYSEEVINKKEYDLGIIIPAYNVEKYIEKCINSILCQKTEYKINVIVVDDGSTDKTLEILMNNYSKKINIMHQKNSGIALCRNRALKDINSKYIMFVDSDDFLSDNIINDMLNMAFNNNLDIIEGNYNEVDERGNIIREVIRNESSDKRNLLGYPWGKVIRSDLFNHLKFPDYLFEDSIMRQIVYEKAENVKICNLKIYNYRLYKNNQSLHHKLKNNRMIESLYITLQLYEDRKKFDIQLNQDYYEYILRMCILTYSRTRYLDVSIIKDIFVIYSDFIIKEFKKYRTINKDKNDLEKSLLTKDFDLFTKYCRYNLLLINKKLR